MRQRTNSWNAVLLLTALCGLASAQQEEPHFVDRVLAGVSFEDRFEHRYRYDPDKGYYLYFDGN